MSDSNDDGNSNINKLEFKVPEIITFPAANSAQRVAEAPKASVSSSGRPKPRAKVILPPGYSPLDWANLNNTQPKSHFANVSHLGRYTLDDIKQHKTRDDAWVALKGKVYDITRYLPFHPGGEKILLSVAGKDATSFFLKYHQWVNEERLLDKCLIGFYVPH